MPSAKDSLSANSVVRRPLDQLFGDEARDGIDMGAETIGTHVPDPHLAPVIGLADVQNRRSEIDLAMVLPVGLIHPMISRWETIRSPPRHGPASAA